MKVKSMILLGLGYVIGSKLGPQQLEAAAKAAIDTGVASSLTERPPATSAVPAWPDADFPT